ncbi:transcriptional regulator, TetR family [Pseudonocardia thermophila]|uniref:Transcriptional regulator, TetR family n=1 Tax=Pseudonocardia thermophila TaxID=1848 RepID=A0A1M6ZN58_PSETH|nr:TetR/AcrR family transcriptional regulator [Pseudonocardia thermophila]SHL31834.1 transcriptional regulator, TetR family [Pseudonocardia thermophila]
MNETYPPPTPRPSRSDVRTRLLDAASEVFLEAGYADARLTDVARRAGLTKGAVYSNFASKLDLFAEVVRSRTAEIAQRAMATVAAGAPMAKTLAEAVVGESRWSLLLTEFAVHALRHPELRSAYAQVRRAQREALTTAITAATAEDPALAERVAGRPEHAALLVLAAVSGLVLDRSADPAAVGVDEVAGALSLLLPAQVDGG